MHDIEPYYKWRDKYVSTEDEKSPFFQKEYDQFKYSSQIYNYYIHPQWDFFGSQTLVLKIIYVNYSQNFAAIELLGEWNDCIGNDIMFLKRDIADHLYEHGIKKFVLLCDNVLNFHGSDDSYYEEWREDTQEYDGWVCLLNLQEHVMQEMNNYMIQNQVHLGEAFNAINWRIIKPENLMNMIEQAINNQTKLLY